MPGLIGLKLMDRLARRDGRALGGREPAGITPELQRRKQTAALLSVGSNTILMLTKLVVGYLTGSISVMSEGVHSGVDLAAALITFAAVSSSGRPPDERHAYGHGKIENVSGIAEAVLIFGASAVIVLKSVQRILYGGEMRVAAYGAAAMGVSILVNLVVARRLFRVADATSSMALRSDALHLLGDVYTSAGVLVGLLVAMATGVHVLDPLAAILLAALIVRSAWKLTVEGMGELLDKSLPEQERRAIIEILEDHHPPVQGYHLLRTRRVGPERHIDMHLLLDDDTPLESAHQLCDHLESNIRMKLPNSHVVLHVEPARSHARTGDRP